MKLYAPKYYKRFKCIADKCSHSCCIGWEIDIDESTYEKYRKVTNGYGAAILDTIENGEYPHFKLQKNDRCPHLDCQGLCKIITCLGEDYLCEICREHPRFYNDTVNGKEVGLGLSCEEACRIILGSDEYDEFFVLEELDTECDELEFDITPYRARIFEILRLDLPYEKRLNIIKEEFNVPFDSVSYEEWLNILSSLEYLEPLHKDLFMSCDFSRSSKNKKALERAFAYFVYRHTTQATDSYELTASLGFALFCESLLASLSKDNNEPLIARIISEELEYSLANTDAIKDLFYKNIL